MLIACQHPTAPDDAAEGRVEGPVADTQDVQGRKARVELGDLGVSKHGGGSFDMSRFSRCRYQGSCFNDERCRDSQSDHRARVQAARLLACSIGAGTAALCSVQDQG